MLHIFKNFFCARKHIALYKGESYRTPVANPNHHVVIAHSSQHQIHIETQHTCDTLY